MRHGRLITLAREGRKAPTKAEAIVWRWLRNRRFDRFKFRRQHPIGEYIADFYSRELRLVIELDGPGHEEPGQMAYDMARTRELAKLGIRVIRIRNEDVFDHPDNAAGAIYFAAITILMERTGRSEMDLMAELDAQRP